MEIASLIIGIISLIVTGFALGYAIVINGKSQESLDDIESLANKNVELTKELHKMYEQSIMKARIEERKNGK